MIKKLINLILNLFRSNTVYFVGSLDKLPEPLTKEEEVYYVEKSMRQIQSLTNEEWQTQIEGKLCAVKDRLSVTPYEQLREFIKAELGELFEEVKTE